LPAPANPANPQKKLFNRDGKAPAQGKVNNKDGGGGEGGEEAPSAEEKAEAQKIMNRANELRRDTPSLTLATAVRMAQREVES